MATGGSKVCRFFNSPRGCWNGDRCRFQHKALEESEKPVCRFYRGLGTCRNGQQCYFRHSNDQEDLLVKTDPGLLDKNNDCLHVQGKSIAVEFPNMTAGSPEQKDVSLTYSLSSSDSKSEGTLYVPGNKSEPSSPLTSDSEACSGVTSPGSEVASLCSGATSPGSSIESTFVTCGECGMKFNTEYDESKHSDTSELENDPLEKHYMEMIMKLDKEHIKFLQSDHRFQHPTSCGVCRRSFVRSRALLCHIVGKIKSGKNDYKIHEDYLDTIIMGFRNRDYGLEEEEECTEWLLLHFVDSYEGSDDDSIGSDSGLAGLLGLMALGKHIHVSGLSMLGTDDDSDSDTGLCPFGFDEDDLYELACQGIKPWDPEAGAALSVLYGL